jgi:hypothetical protein
MAGEVVRADIGFGFDDPSREFPASETANENLAHKLARHVKRRAFVEIAG